MADTTLDSVTLHNGANAVITENNSRKESTLTVLPVYLSDSDETDIFDFGGVTKLINFTGSYTGETIAAVKTFIDSVETLVQGHQDIDAGYPLTLTDDIRGTIKVKIFDFSSTYTEGDPFRVSWTLKLAESSENA